MSFTVLVLVIQTLIWVFGVFPLLFFLFFFFFLSPSPETRAVEMRCLLIVTAQDGNQFAVCEINTWSTVIEKPN
jgi:ABC-type amino acid transport system permease subunit